MIRGEQRELQSKILEKTAETINEFGKVQREIAKYLSPDNENVKQGYWVAALRDIQQIRVSSQDLVQEQEKRIATLGQIIQEFAAELRRISVRLANSAITPAQLRAMIQAQDRGDL